MHVFTQFASVNWKWKCILCHVLVWCFVRTVAGYFSTAEHTVDRHALLLKAFCLFSAGRWQIGQRTVSVLKTSESVELQQVPLLYSPSLDEVNQVQKSHKAFSYCWYKNLKEHRELKNMLFIQLLLAADCKSTSINQNKWKIFFSVNTCYSENPERNSWNKSVQWYVLQRIKTSL